MNHIILASILNLLFLNPKFWITIDRTHCSVKFPGEPTIEIVPVKGINGEFIYFSEVSNNDTVTYSMLFSPFPELALRENCFSEPECMAPMYEKGISNALSLGPYSLKQTDEIVIEKNYSWQAFEFTNLNKTQSGKVRIYIAKDKAYTLCVGGHNKVLELSGYQKFFENFILKNE